MNRLICLFLGLCLACQADTNYVVPPGTPGTPTPAYLSWNNAATSIIDAVNASSNNNVVLLTNNSTYRLTNEVVISKTITIRSSDNNRNNTFVDGNYPNTTNRCIRTTVNAVISGFTISNGCGYNGGAVYMYPGMGILTNCIISGSFVTGVDCQGGGVYCINSGLVVDCVVIGNSNAQYGGGVYLSGGASPGASPPIIRDCRIISNSAGTGAGGGIMAQNSSTISNCEITGNSAGSGGGVFANKGTIVDSCVITSNGAGYAVYLQNPDTYANAVVRNCVISYNDGAVDCELGNIVQNCLITRHSGDAVVLSSMNNHTGYIANCTIVSNASAGVKYGGAANVNTDCVFNCIIVSNRWNIYDTATPKITNAYWNCCSPGYATFPPGRGNITSDPRFIDAITGGTNNWRLANNSPCLNTGTNMSWMTNSFDLDGRARIRYGRVDIGAYELINEATLYGFQ